jgi:hypothetical protein
MTDIRHVHSSDGVTPIPLTYTYRVSNIRIVGEKFIITAICASCTDEIQFTCIGWEAFQRLVADWSTY